MQATVCLFQLLLADITFISPFSHYAHFTKSLALPAAMTHRQELVLPRVLAI